MKIEVPDNHLIGMRVPKGGSSCLSCEYLSDNKQACQNHYYQRFNNDKATLPAPADQYCCDFYEADPAWKR